jgi:hypothetical protein
MWWQSCPAMAPWGLSSTPLGLSLLRTSAGGSALTMEVQSNSAQASSLLHYQNACCSIRSLHVVSTGLGYKVKATRCCKSFPLPHGCSGIATMFGTAGNWMGCAQYQGGRCDVHTHVEGVGHSHMCKPQMFKAHACTCLAGRKFKSSMGCWPCVAKERLLVRSKFTFLKVVLCHGRRHNGHGLS